MSQHTTPGVETPAWIIAVRAGAVLAAAVGVGRFVFTPILPLMEDQTSLTSQGASLVATANYLGYLLGALLGIARPTIGYSRLAMRVSSIILLVSLAAMPMTESLLAWGLLRGIAGLASALIFVVAGNAILTTLAAAKPQLIGWAYGGLGVGIAVSGALVSLVAGVADWRATWLAAAAFAMGLIVVGWSIGATPSRPDPPQSSPLVRAPLSAHRNKPALVWLTLSYFFEGTGYIIAGTFLVAAIAATGPAWLSGNVWMLVGLAIIPSCAIWASIAARHSRLTVIAVALLLQAAGIALPAFFASPLAALVGAVLFGATFMGVTTLSLAEGRTLGAQNATAVLTAAYSVGQVAGPLIVAPLLHDGFQTALMVGAALVLCAAAAAAVAGRRGKPAQNDQS